MAEAITKQSHRELDNDQRGEGENEKVSSGVKREGSVDEII